MGEVKTKYEVAKVCTDGVILANDPSYGDFRGKKILCLKKWNHEKKCLETVKDDCKEILGVDYESIKRALCPAPKGKE